MSDSLTYRDRYKLEHGFVQIETENETFQAQPSAYEKITRAKEHCDNYVEVEGLYGETIHLEVAEVTATIFVSRYQAKLMYDDQCLVKSQTAMGLE